MNSDTAQSKSDANQPEQAVNEQAGNARPAEPPSGSPSEPPTETAVVAEASAAAKPDSSTPTDKAQTKADAAAPGGRESAREQLLKSDLAQLVVAIFRAPDQHSEHLSGKAPLPKGLLPFLEAVADASGQAPMRGLQEGQPAPQSGQTELARAVRYFIYKVLHISAADHYRVLGVGREAKLGDIQQGYRVLRRLLGSSADDDQANMAVMRLSEAYVVLRDPERRHAYDMGASLRLQSSNAGEAMGGAGLGTVGSAVPKAAKSSKRLSMSTYVALVLLSLVIYAGYYLHSKKLREEAAQQVAQLNQSVTAPGTGPAVEGVTPAPGTESSVGAAVDAGAGAQKTLQDLDRFASPTVTPATPPAQETKALPQPNITSEPAKQELMATPPASTPVESRVAVIPIVPPSSSGDSAGGEDAALKRRVSSLLARAQQQIKQGQITVPVGNNAHETYLEILKFAPGNVEATAGLNGIADRYLGLARYRLNRDQLDDAEEMVVRGLAMASGHSGLLSLRDKIESRRKELAVAQEKQSETVIAAAATTSEATSASQAQPQPQPQAPSVDLPAATTNATTIPVAPASPVTAPSTVETAAPVATPNAVSDEISDKDLNALLDKFVLHYEAGQLDQFMALFAQDAQTNNRTTRAGVAEDYRSLFESSVSRVMRLRDLRWNRQGQQAFGEADFSLSIVSRGEVRPRSYEGRLTFQVVRQDGQLFIRGLFHSQRKTNGQ